MARSRLHELSAHGVSVWMDSLSREMLETGELARLIDEDAVVGVTSNPTIFEKALSTGGWYDDQLRDVLERHDDTKEVFIELAVRDVQQACDLLRPAWEQTQGVDGRVSIEVDPDLAYDRDASFDEAIRLHELVDRANAYVKIPGTEPGLGAIEDCIAAGRSINVTLIFSLERHAAVVEAYIRGLERLAADGGDLSQAISVASFFVSRVDTEADRRLEELGRTDLQGKLAVANAKLAYQHYLATFAGERWERLAVGRSSPAAVPVGLDLDEEPRVPRRPLRRGAHRPGHGEHDAGRDDRGVPGSRRGAGHAHGGDRRGDSALRRPR